MGDGAGEVQVGRGRFLAGPEMSKKKLTEGAALAGRARNEQPPTQSSAGGLRMGEERAVWVEVKKDEGLGGAVVRKMGVV
jgi:hypothetical protein